MSTIKAYTDLKQSKKLAEILPLESADMYYSHEFVNSAGDYYKINIASEGHFDDKELLGSDITAWSLAALLSILPNKIVSHETAFEGEDAEGINDIYYKCIESTEDDRYMCRYVGNGYKYKCVADNPVDACYSLILKLHDLNLL